MRVEFLGSFIPEDEIEEVVFIGRSNVGKSSLINMIAGKQVAKTSKEPGRTKNVNVYLLDKKLKLIDVPGYGYAKVSKEERESWRELMERYFIARKEYIRCAYVLIDSVVGPTELDLLAMDWLKSLGINHKVVLTKTDKASQKELSNTLKKLESVGIKDIILTSAKEGKGRKELLESFKTGEKV